VAVAPYADPVTVRGAAGVSGKVHPQWVAFLPSSVRRTVVIALLLVVALLVGLWAFNALSSFLFILLLAWLLSIAMESPVLALTERGVRRSAATGITMLVGFLIIAGLAEVFGSVFYSQVSELSSALPSTISTTLQWVNTTFHTNLDVASIQASMAPTPNTIGQWAGQYGGGILGVFGSVAAFVFDALTVLVFAFYLSADSPVLRQTIGSWLPQSYQSVFITVWEISVAKTGGYVISKLILAGLSAAFHTAFFYAIGVPSWLPLGLLAGIIGQFIPTIGTYIGVIVPALFTWLTAPLNVVWIVVFATIYQQIENYVFTPRISQRTMDVHPAVALGSVIAGAALFGPIGALIGIPLAAVALSIINTFSQSHDLLPELASLTEDDEPPPEVDDERA
jgi:predicted PurR-regulated permease PerM